MNAYKYMALSRYSINIHFFSFPLSMSQHLMCLPRKKQKTRQQKCNLWWHECTYGSGMLEVIHVVYIPFPWFASGSGSLILNGKQDGEGTQRLPPTQEPGISQALVNDVMCGVGGNQGCFS